MLKTILTYFFRTLLIASLLSLSTFASAKVFSKIIGGRVADADASPWMAGLVYKGESPYEGQFCGASLIAKDWVLTAAHCVYEESPSSFEVIINQPNLTKSTGERSTVERIIIHPKFDDVQLYNDLALVKLKTPSSQKPIILSSPYSNFDFTGNPVVALGWGLASTTEKKYPENLQQVGLSIIDTAKCSKALRAYGGVTDKMLCAGVDSGKKDTCNGDSGGPLLVFDKLNQSWKQVGITSWGADNCAVEGSYGVYTRVKDYAEFISDNICSATQKPKPVALALSVKDFVATANWSTSDKATGYRLHYAPFPSASPIYSIDLNNLTEFSAAVGAGNAFYVGITSYYDNCLGDFSNIEHFVVK